MNVIRTLFAVGFLLAPPPLFADRSGEFDALVTQSTADFPRLPTVRHTPDIGTVCGGGVTVPPVYCTTSNEIWFDASAAIGARAATFLLAHLFGHGLQVRYGIADLALAAIRAEPAREAELRGMVERQNDCFAGVLLARAGLPLPDLAGLFDDDPLAGPHWGRDPVRNGPAVRVPLSDRAEWLAIGYRAAEPAACSVGDVSADLIAAADPRPAGQPRPDAVRPGHIRPTRLANWPAVLFQKTPPGHSFVGTGRNRKA